MTLLVVISNSIVNLKLLHDEFKENKWFQNYLLIGEQIAFKLKFTDTAITHTICWHKFLK